MHEKSAPPLVPFLERTLRTLIRLCLPRGIRIQEFEEIAKRAFIAEAKGILAAEGADKNVSRMSIMTGLHRREVSRLDSEESTIEVSGGVLGKIIGQWRTDRKFKDQSGKPKILTVEGASSQFVDLVHSVSKDLNSYTILFELERVGAVRRTGNKLRLDAEVYVPRKDHMKSLALLADDVDDLVSATAENIFGSRDVPNLHVKTYYDDVCPEFIPKIRAWFLEEGGKFHEKARKFLAQFDRDTNTRLEDRAGGVKVSLGTFSLVVEEESK